MTDNKKKNIKAGIVTIVVHAAIVLLLAFLTLSAVHPDKNKEDGVPVLLGMVEDAGGEDLGGLPSDAGEESEAEEATTEAAEEEVPLAPAPKPQPAPAPKPEPKQVTKPTPAPKPQPSTKPLITQEQEKSIAAEEAKKKAAEEAARKKAAEEAAKKAAAEKAAAAAANSRVTGAFGNAGNKGSSGNTTGDGAQGSPTGNSNTGKTTGVGGMGTSATVGTRSPLLLPKPVPPANVEGNVNVSIQVDEAGNVIDAKVIYSQSPALNAPALEAARKAKFTKGTKVENGIIRYKVILQQ